MLRPDARYVKPVSARLLSLAIEINEVTYLVYPITAPGADRAYRLFKDGPTGEPYDVYNHEGVSRCDCPDYIYRRADHGTSCKHVMALENLGLLPKNRARPVNSRKST